MRFAAAIALTLLLSQSAATAQLAEQTFLLEPGWNSIFLEVQPDNNAAAAVFAGIPVASVWAWNYTGDTVEYIQNPSELTPEQPEWLVHFPPERPESVASSLFAVQAGTAYLVELEGAQTVPLTVAGEPRLPRINWKPDSFNLVGFHATPGQGPTFADFFAPSGPHGNSIPTVYRLDAFDDWQLVDPQTTNVVKGEAYWVYCAGDSQYTGPLEVVAQQGRALNFDRILVEQELRIVNRGGSSATISVEPLPGLTRGLGDVPLSMWVPPPAPDAGWEELDSEHSEALAAGDEKRMRLAIRRSGLSAGSYDSLLSISGQGMTVVLPVMGTQTDRAGLWVGTAEVGKVNFAGNLSDPDTPVSTASQAQLRLIVHVDGGGAVRLLREVTQLWEDGAPGEAGRFVLITDPELLDDFTGPGIRDGHPVGRRVSSAVFSFPAPLSMQGSFAPGSTLEVDYEVGQDDPLNPFTHRYHPDHQPADAYVVQRAIFLDLTTTDPDNLDLSVAGWGDRDVGGIYREQITGLHRRTLYVEGTFRLHKVSDIDELDPSPGGG